MLKLICLVFFTTLAFATGGRPYGQSTPDYAPASPDPYPPAPDAYQPVREEYAPGQPQAYDPYDAPPQPRVKYGHKERRPQYNPQPAPQWGGGDSYGASDYQPAPKQALLSNGKGAVIAMRLSLWWCTYKNSGGYREMSGAFDRAEPTISVNQDDGASTITLSVTEEELRATDKKFNKGSDSQPAQQGDKSQSENIAAISQSLAANGQARPARGAPRRVINYKKYRHCKLERHVVLAQLAGKKDYLKKYRLEGVRIVGGYANVPITVTKMFTTEIDAPAAKSTYGTQYGALGYAKDAYVNEYQRRSGWGRGYGHGRGHGYGYGRAEKNAILSIWGWALFCKPSYSYGGPIYGRGNYNGYQKRSGYAPDNCWKEGIEVSLDLDYPKKHYCHVNVWNVALDNGNVVVGAVPLKKELPKPSYRQPSYRQPSYAPSNYGSDPYQ